MGRDLPAPPRQLVIQRRAQDNFRPHAPPNIPLRVMDALVVVIVVLRVWGPGLALHPA